MHNRAKAKGNDHEHKLISKRELSLTLIFHTTQYNFLPSKHTTHTLGDNNESKTFCSN